MKNNGKLRLSYSLLDIWSKGETDRAISMYLHLDKLGTKAMEEGKTYHEKWRIETKKNKSLKLGNTTINFINPKPEYEICIPYNERWDIKMVADCLDNDTIYEYKTGTCEALEYARGYQIPLYFLVCELSGIIVEKAIIINYNQHIKKANMVIVWNNMNLIDKAKNYIDSLAPEIEQHFIKHGLILPIEN